MRKISCLELKIMAGWRLIPLRNKQLLSFGLLH